jgi:GAF domain-containing protein
VKAGCVRHDFQDDIDAIASIPAIGTILEVVCRTTGMGFAAVARVTEERWICCAVKDDLAFGLVPGGELKVETTICNEIRGHGNAVAIDEVNADTHFCGHPTPALYGFQSYISVPITLADGTFFGTLCSLDPRPHAVNTVNVLGMYRLFALLIAHEVELRRQIQAMETENAALKAVFRAGLGHDMKNTLTAVTASARLLHRTPLNERAQMIVSELEASAERLSRQISEAMGEDAASTSERPRQGTPGSHPG